MAGSGPPVLCIGAVHWDLIARHEGRIAPGADVPGRIVRRPGGVAGNVALALAEGGVRPVLLSAVGDDPAGRELLAACTARGVDCAHVLCAPGGETGAYLAIEDDGGLVAAVADARLLEAAGAGILAPLGRTLRLDGGVAVIDGNLPAETLAAVASAGLAGGTDLRLVPASPEKAPRLRVFLGHARAVFHLNVAEAAAILGRVPGDAAEAALGMVAAGAARAVVTDGPRAAADAGGHGLLTGVPPVVRAAGVTGAGDRFLAAHLLAGRAGADPRDALDAALAAAAAHVAG
jgi:sugar/nucleoside kinase (ribokinase family)